MRKYIHPYLKETMIQTKDGSLYMKRWLYFRAFLPLEIDYTKNINWKKPKQDFESIKKENLKKIK